MKLIEVRKTGLRFRGQYPEQVRRHEISSPGIFLS